MFSSGLQSTYGSSGSTPTYTATSAQSTGTTSTGAKGSTQMDMNSFLIMFTKQLEYQDPSNPMESYELAAQLAQFSTVSELTKANNLLQTQQTYLSSINNAQMIGTIGKDVTGLDDSIQLSNGEISKGSFKIDSPAASVTVKIKDGDGNVVRTMQVGAQDAGTYNIAWDGCNDAGTAMSDGTYHFDVEALDADGNTIEAQETIKGTVSGFRVDSGIPYLILGGSNGVKLPISAVMEVNEHTTA